MKKQSFVSTHQRLEPSILNYLKDLRYQFETQMQKLDGLSPLKVMDKGYGLLEKDQKIITSIHDVNIYDSIKVTLKDGILQTQIKDKKER
jgi:exodeoxyribonuclease VII large subunit